MSKHQEISDAELDRQIAAANRRSQNNISEPKAISVGFQDGRIHIRLSNGWNFDFNPRELTELRDATDEQLRSVKLWGVGETLEWTALDVHIGIGAILFALIGEKYLQHEIAVRRGSIKSAKRAAASAANGKLGGRPPKNTASNKSA